MEKLIIESPQQWLRAQQLKSEEPIPGLMPPLYIKETVVYEFYKWSHRKAQVNGIAIGLAIAVAIAAIVKLVGV